jgi:autotransporter-associated beta strand protein
LNSGTSVANIGYLGTGGSYAAPATITLMAPITAESLVFGVAGGSTTTNNHYYALTGSSITIGDGTDPGLITIDVGNYQSSGDSFVYSNLTVAGGQGLELGVTADPANPNRTGTITSYHYLKGTNTFSSLTIDNAAGAGASSRNWAYINGAPSFTSGVDVTMGIGAGIIDTAASGTMTVGTINMSAPAFSYIPLGYAIRGNQVIQIGPGNGSGIYPTIVVNGPIQASGGGVGQCDVIFSSSATGTSGQGTVVLNGQSNYAGITAMNQYSCRSVDADGPMSIVQLGIDNALPTTTDLSFGEANGNSGALDLHGFNQTVNSISTWYKSTSNYHGGVTNFTGTMSTLTINDTVGNNAKFEAVIGKLLTGTSAQIASSTDNIALHLASTNIGSLTLGLAQIEPGSSMVAASTSNTYNGGTIVDGGALYAANGLTYATTGTRNSATGVGPVTVNNGGTLGGSPAGGAVGMPTTGAVTVNNGGTLVPAGGSWTTAAAPVFNVLGDLTLNAGSTVNYSFDAAHLDEVAVGGSLTLPTSGQVTININDLGGLHNAVPLFTFGNLVNAFNSSSFVIGGLSTPAPSGFAYGFARNGSEIDLLAPWKGSFKTWVGAGGGGVWDVSSTANFASGGTATVFNNGDVVVFNDTTPNNNVTVAAGGVRPGSPLTFANNAVAYTISGGPINDSTTGQTTLIISGGGHVTLNNSNGYTGDTQILNHSTLTLGTAAAISPSSTVQLSGNSTLQFGASMTGASQFTNNINFNAGSIGASASPVLDTQGYNVEASGVIFSSLYGGNATIGFTKMGTGELLLSNANDSYYTGLTNIVQGTIRVNSVATAPGQSYSALGSGNINVQNGATLYLDGASAVGGQLHIGVNQNQTTSNILGWMDLYSGATLKGTGDASYERGDISPVLNYISGTTYSAGSVTFATGTSSTDVLAIKDSVKQYDPGYLLAGNEYGNWVVGTPGNGSTGYADPAKLITAHVTGAGVVKLQDGGVSSYKTFGGCWSVDSGVLQIGPFVPNPTPDPNPTSTGWGGPYGEPLNALGFHTPNGQSYPGTQADPDLPNAVTVNAGGILAVAVDQVNANPNVTSGPVNPTPDYLRNPVTLNGGAIAATGYEVSFSSSPTGAQGVATSTLVTARFGGDFTVGSGTSEVLTYDPIGGTGARTVELVGGSRYLANASIGWAAGSTITYATNWGGTLTVDSNGATGGAFNIRRTAASGPVTVTSGATLNILAGATVNIMGANVDADGSYDLAGTYHVARNNVFKDDSSANVVAIDNAGQFNVNSGVQTVGAINGAGTTSVNADVNNPGTTLDTPQINQAVVAVNGGTLSIGAYNSLVGTITLTSGAITGSAGTLTSTGGFTVQSGMISTNLAGSSGLIKGTSGTVTLSGTNTYAGTTTVNGGRLVLSGPAAWGPALNNASGTNIEAGKLVFDYTTSGAGTDPVATVRSDLLSGLIHSSTAPAGCTIGYDDNNSTGNGVANGVMLEIAVAGDANLDGTVNAADLNKVLANWGKTNQTWTSGDFNYDGVVNAADLNKVLANWGKTLPAGLDSSLGGLAGAAGPCSAVPEPGTLALLAAGLMGLLAYAWRKRK